MKQNYIYLRKPLTEIDVYIRKLPYRNDISAKNKLILVSHPSKAEFHKFVYLDAHDVVLDTALGRRVVKTVFEHGHSYTELDTAIGHTFSEKTLHELENNMILGSNKANVIRELYSSGENEIEIIAASDAEPQITKCFSAENIFELGAAVVGAGSTAKSISISHDMSGRTLRQRILSEADVNSHGEEHCLAEFDENCLSDIDRIMDELVVTAHAVLEKWCSAEEIVTNFGSSVNTLMIRYRSLFETDGENYLADFGESNLNDMDYITL